jgi:transcriptional antiterminator RfaH
MAEACPSGRSWYALTVKPRHEKTVAGLLAAKGLESYAPLYREQKRWSDRIKTVERAMFPSYVFCRFGFDDRLQVLGTYFVGSIVGFGGKPTPVREAEIRAIKTILASDLPVSPSPALPGQRVLIFGGPLAGLTGTLAREKTGDRVIVGIEAIHRAVAVEVDRDLIEVIVAETGRQSARPTQASGGLSFLLGRNISPDYSPS